MLHRPRKGERLGRTARPTGLHARQRLLEAVLRDLCMGMGVAPGYGYGYGCLCHGYGLPLSPMHLCHGYGYGCLQAGELVGERIPAEAQLREGLLRGDLVVPSLVPRHALEEGRELIGVHVHAPELSELVLRSEACGAPAGGVGDSSTLLTHQSTGGFSLSLSLSLSPSLISPGGPPEYQEALLTISRRPSCRGEPPAYLYCFT